MSKESKKLRQILEWFESKTIEYVLVGEDVVELQSCIMGDIDIVVSNSSISKINTTILELCNSLGMQCVQLLQHEQTAYFFVTTWLDENHRHYLKLDICSDYLRNNQLVMTAEELLKNRRKDISNFHIPSPKNNFTYYLIKKIDKGTIDKAQFEYLCKQLDLCDNTLVPNLEKIFGKKNSGDIIALLKQKDFTRFKTEMKNLKDVIHYRSRRSIKDVWSELRRVINRIFFPTGVWLTIYGPDGCGKSSVVDKLLPAISAAFRRTQTVHFRPRLGCSASSTSTPVVDPHGGELRDPITSIIKMGYYATDYIIGYFIKVLPARIKSTLFIFDRYYDDIIIDPRRYRYGGPKFLLKFIRIFIPKPDLVFCLDAEPEVLQARKKEVSQEECSRQRNEYRSLVEALPNGHVIDASRPLNEVVHDVETIILKHMEKRSNKRLEL